MSFDWKEEWENHSEQETREMEATSEDKLLQQITAGYYGNYYAIWYAVAHKNNPNKSIPVLTQALHHIETHRAIYYDKLSAIHCAIALCDLAKIKDETLRSDLIYGDRKKTIKFFEQFSSEE